MPSQPNSPSLAGRRRDERIPIGRERAPVRKDDEAADEDEGDQHGHLDRDDDVVDLGRFRDAEHEQQREHRADQEGRQVEDRGDRRRRPPAPSDSPSGPVSCAGHMDADVAEQAHHIARPADRDDGRREAVFEQQQRAHHPGGELADRGVGIGVGRARDRQGRGQFGIAQAGEGADDAGDDEGEQHGRARRAARRHCRCARRCRRR